MGGVGGVLLPLSARPRKQKGEMEATFLSAPTRATFSSGVCAIVEVGTGAEKPEFGATSAGSA